MHALALESSAAPFEVIKPSVSHRVTEAVQQSQGIRNKSVSDN